MRAVHKYDYIIAGAGCAGLSLLMHLLHSGEFSAKKILLIDKAPKSSNDRTWCFWETQPGLFEPVVRKQWQQAWFHTDEFSRLLDIAPYQYKMIRGIDLYTYCFDTIVRQNNIDVVYAAVESIDHEKSCLYTTDAQFYGEYIFNSIQFEWPQLKKGEFFLLQHFKGWMIETRQPFFNDAQATLMDFRVPQQHGTTFTYVLPVSPTLAMVEYTLFTQQLLPQEAYDAALRDYINNFIGVEYEVKEEETGIIPMTNHEFTRARGNVVNIGSAGGQTKPSSGYTFHFIQQHSKAITYALLTTGKPFTPSLHPRRFRYYDSVLLNVLATGKLPGKKVFSNLFRKNNPAHILKFLDNKSSLYTDARIILSLPTIPFLVAGMQEI